MIFAEHERAIYSPEGSDDRYDPLALARALTVASGGRLNAMLADWRGGFEDAGDVSPDGRAAALVASAEAEAHLAAVARLVFGVPDFPAATDAVALELLCDYLGWMEKKGERAATSRPSPAPSPEAFASNGTTACSSAST
jgi:hypothetical protein